MLSLPKHLNLPVDHRSGILLVGTISRPQSRPLGKLGVTSMMSYRHPRCHAEPAEASQPPCGPPQRDPLGGYYKPPAVQAPRQARGDIYDVIKTPLGVMLSLPKHLNLPADHRRGTLLVGTISRPQSRPLGKLGVTSMMS